MPLTADADAVLLAVDTAQMIEKLLPKTEIIFVRNGRYGPIRFDLPALKSVKPELKTLFARPQD